MSQELTQEQSIEQLEDDKAEGAAPADEAPTAELDQAEQPTQG